MLRSRSLALALVAASVAAAAGSCRPPAPERPPRLLVVIVVDQMRPDFLERFGPHFEGGLARFRDGALRFTDARQDHWVTATAPGHATLATGRVPAVHGIVGNWFWDRAERRVVYAVEDPASPRLGPAGPRLDESFADRRGPALLRTTTLGDWIGRAHPGARIFSVALKDRAAIAMAGGSADAAYFWDVASGSFTTVAHYRNDLPAWVVAFHAEGPVDALRGLAWEREPGAPFDARTRADASPHERGFDGNTFPHRPRPGSFHADLVATPFGDRLALEFAARLVVEEGLGTDDVPDLLWVGASAADYIGHDYGPFSAEVEDYFLKLDRYLAAFFATLDDRVGRSNYVVALSSDHGIPPVPGTEHALADARRIPSDEIERRLATLADRLGTPVPQLASGFAIDVGGDDGPSVRAAFAEAIRAWPEVEEVVTYDELLADDGSASLRDYRLAFDPERAADLIVRWCEGCFLGDGSSATTHGSPYAYDRHVPLAFLGPGIAAGRDATPVRTVDLAPTLAALVGVPVPDDLDGRALDLRAGAAR